jgi:hypothetical protein
MPTAPRKWPLASIPRKKRTPAIAPNTAYTAAMVVAVWMTLNDFNCRMDSPRGPVLRATARGPFRARL